MIPYALGVSIATTAIAFYFRQYLRLPGFLLVFLPWLDPSRLSTSFLPPLLSDNERMELWRARGVMKKDAQRDVETDLHRSDLQDPSKDAGRLRSVLLAYAGRRPSIGYTQGMNLMASYLLSLGLETADTYYALSYLLEEIGVEYLGEGMAGVKRDTETVERAVKECGGVDESGAVAFMTASILPSLGAAVFNFETTKRLWDAVLYFERRGWLGVVVGMLGVDCGKKGRDVVKLEIEEINAQVRNMDVEEVLIKAAAAMNTLGDRLV